MGYNGSLTPDEQTKVRTALAERTSVRQTAKKLDLSYGKVRAFAEYDRRNPSDLIPPPETGPRILIFDIETSPQEARGFFHGKYRQSIREVTRHSHLLTGAYAWLGIDEIGFIAQWDDPHWEPMSEDDYWVAVRLHVLFDQADIVIAHYGDKFDIPVCNDRWLVNGLGPPSPYQSIDTKSESSKRFKTVSHSLGDLAVKHGIEEKLTNSGWDMWIGCMEGDPESQLEMKTYNIQDVVALRDWYLHIRGWIGSDGKKKHPNLGHWVRGTDAACPNCGRQDTLILNKWRKHRTQHYEYATFHCEPRKGGCGRYSRQAGVRRKIEPEDRIYAT